MHEVVWLNHFICTTKLQSKDQIIPTSQASNFYAAIIFCFKRSYQVRLTVSVVAESLAAVVAVKLPDEDEGEEDDDDEDDGDGDADQDGGVVRVRADRLGPGRLAELVGRGVGSDLKKIFRNILHCSNQISNNHVIAFNQKHQFPRNNFLQKFDILILRK